jgi:uncharacterized membrane protein YphA (DoxX/SURF4 family)
MSDVAQPVLSPPTTAGAGLAWRPAVGVAGAFVLGLVLLVASWAKVLAPQAFVEQIRLEGLDFLLPATVVAFLALGIEIGLGTALVLAMRRWWVLVPAALLVLFFLFLTGRAYWLDAHGLLPEGAGCGCFGALLERTPAEAFWQDLLLLVPPLLLAFVGRPRGARFPRVRTAVTLLVTAAALLFAWKAPSLPLDDLATRLKPGVEIADLCSGRGAQRICMDLLLPELASGEHTVILTGLEDSVRDAVPALNESVFADDGARLWALTAADSADLQAFQWSAGPAFEIREAPPGLLAPLYRRLPRSFRVTDGTVTATYDGLPPEAIATPP